MSLVPPSRPRAGSDRSLDWRARSACRHTDPELFFPVGTAPHTQLQQQRALAVCAGCTVVRDCRDHALALGVLDGIWGGLLPEQRRLLRSDARPRPGRSDWDRPAATA